MPGPALLRRWGVGARAAMVLLAGAALSAHVGSPDTWFEGAAGPYPIRVNVRTPGIVPGLADITVRVKGGGATRVTVRPFRWDVGANGAPAADVAQPVAGDAELYTAQLWLMAFGSYSVDVAVSGPKGEGSAVVPVMAVATRTLHMDPVMGLALAGLGIFLVVGAVTIVGASVRESVLPPGEAPPPARITRARKAMALAAGLLVAAVVGGRFWWQVEDRAHERLLFRQSSPAISIRQEAGITALNLAVGDSARWNGGRTFSPIMPDHGKLMHLFLVREPALDAFAHLHPGRTDSLTFSTPLPALPAGRYRLYADIVHESGFAQTLVGTATLGTPSPAHAVDPDDATLVGAAPVAAGSAFRFADGASLTWVGASTLGAGQETTLAFELRNAKGEPLAPEPYLGMAGHVILTREDGAVFNHLHPAGTASMAAQLRLTLRQRGDTSRAAYVAAMDSLMGAHGAHAMPMGDSRLEFPYAFPQPGRYVLWVQCRVQGEVRTAAFQITVAEGATKA